ncbi:zinc finger matrin-type protein 3-like [Cylas formicarius]|uniref:zinc finger matrin-type protein 3-like n=1 Tax=Cylas formicarius TaxID=197179 RepID=UPI0029584B8C|nr:zinc finger matrin-type protein 3-like [Cylas formicarius]
MQLNEDGEYFSDKLNFRIPKRKTDEIEPRHTSYQLNARYNQQNTPLANSYYNYPYDPKAASAYYGNYAQYYSQYNNSSGNQSNPDPIKHNIYKALDDLKEKPKNQNTKNIFQSTVPDLVDNTLPKDLKLLFQPLFCKLCSTQFSSNNNAKMHYQSKNHEKKIKKWLIDYSEKSGEPLHKRARTSDKNEEEAQKNPSWFHCDVCDLPLTGRLHAESHYMGKPHQSVLMGHKKPAGQGYYDEEGKWIRLKTVKSKPYNFANGEDNFGISFKKEQEQKKPAAPLVKFHCEVCDINTTCAEQLENHYRGQKHQKKLKQMCLSHPAQKESAERIGSPPVLPLVAPEQVVCPEAVGQIDLAIYRLPSGDYYCPTCNNTTNSEAQFLQHVKSKNHWKKSQQKTI